MFRVKVTQYLEPVTMETGQEVGEENVGESE